MRFHQLLEYSLSPSVSSICNCSGEFSLIEKKNKNKNKNNIANHSIATFNFNGRSLEYLIQWISSLIFFDIHIVISGYLLALSMFVGLCFICLLRCLKLDCCFYSHIFYLVANLLNFLFHRHFITGFKVIWCTSLRE